MMPAISRSEAVGWGFGGVLSIIFLFGLAAVTFVGGFAYGSPDKAKDLGQLGDFVGGVLNPSLTFLTFIGLLLTLRLQKKELVLTRNELERSADALENQLASLKNQSFENTFFRLLEFQNSIVNSIDLRYGTEIIKGRDCFNLFYDRLKNEYDQLGGPNKVDRLNEAYQAFWGKYQSELGHYYRFLYNFIRFLDQQSADDRLYIKLLRSQLSDQELLLLFYNCLSPQGEKFKGYVEKYALLDNLPGERLLDQLDKERFNPSAFGE